MRRLTKAVVTAFCLSTLCSSLICTSSFMSVSAAEKVDGVKPIELVVTDKNEYFETSEDGYITVKKEGYYSVVFPVSIDGSLNYVPIVSKDSYVDREHHDEFKSSLDDAKVFSKCAVGDTLYLRTTTVISNDNYYVIYSEDGVTAKDVLYVSTELLKYNPVNENIVPSITNSKLTETDTKATFSATLSVDEGTLGLVEVMYMTDDYFEVLESFRYDTASADFSYEFVQNGTYRICCYSCDGSATAETVEVNCIDTSVVIDDPFTDSEPPKLTIETPSATGLTEGVDICAIKVTANEVCDIGVGTFSESEVTEFTGYVYSNGVYEVTAKDSWGNITTEEVKITAFGDGSLPGEGSDEDGTAGIVGLANDNPLNGSNRDSYWASAGEDDSASGGSSVLPQTGSPTWFAMVAGVAAVTATAGGIAVKKSGILKRRKGDTKK